MATKFFDHIQGSSTMALFQCDKCGEKWAANKILPCPICEPENEPVIEPDAEKSAG